MPPSNSKTSWKSLEACKQFSGSKQFAFETRWWPAVYLTCCIMQHWPYVAGKSEDVQARSNQQEYQEILLCTKIQWSATGETLWSFREEAPGNFAQKFLQLERYLLVGWKHLERLLACSWLRANPNAFKGEGSLKTFTLVRIREKPAQNDLLSNIIRSSATGGAKNLQHVPQSMWQLAKSNSILVQVS